MNTELKPGEVYPGVTSDAFHGIPADKRPLAEIFANRAPAPAHGALMQKAMRHEVTMLHDATKKERRERVMYAASCSCGWHSRWYVLPSASMHAANEHEHEANR